VSPSQFLWEWSRKAEQVRRRYLPDLDPDDRAGRDGTKRAPSPSMIAIYLLILRLARATADCPLGRGDFRDKIEEALDYKLCSETIDARIEELREIGYLKITKSEKKERSAEKDGRKCLVTPSQATAEKLDEMDGQLLRELIEFLPDQSLFSARTQDHSTLV
jgi:hypothetical protein